MRIQALSVKQPWAYAILRLGKNVENRTWWTPYRGDLVIHAPKTRDDRHSYHAIREIMQAGMGIPAWHEDELLQELGAIVGVVELVDVVQRHQGSRWAETPDRLGRPYHWLLRNPRVLPEPIPARGFQGLWEPTVDDLREIGRQLAGDRKHIGARQGPQLSLFGGAAR